MMRPPLASLLLGLIAPLGTLALAGCPEDPAGNPKVLWLALDGAETRVRLVDTEPPPY
jgi:hypothetical protein